MSGYTLKITAKLLLKSTTAHAMAEAAKRIEDLAPLLAKHGLCDVSVADHYVRKLVSDASYNDASDQTQG